MMCAEVVCVCVGWGQWHMVKHVSLADPWNTHDRTDRTDRTVIGGIVIITRHSTPVHMTH